MITMKRLIKFLFLLLVISSENMLIWDLCSNIKNQRIFMLYKVLILCTISLKRTNDNAAEEEEEEEEEEDKNQKSTRII